VRIASIRDPDLGMAFWNMLFFLCLPGFLLGYFPFSPSDVCDVTVVKNQVSYSVDPLQISNTRPS